MKKIREILSGGAIRSMGILVGGAALSQLIVLAALPFVTRLFAPTDFSVLAVYSAILGVFSAAACLRFDIAIPLPEDEGEARNLLTLAMLSAFLVSFISLVLLFIFSEQVLRLIGNKEFDPYLYLIPLGIWFGSSYSALVFWATRKKRFLEISKTRLTQALGSVFFQVLLGTLFKSPLGLLIGFLASSGLGIFGLVRGIFKIDRSQFSRLGFSGLKATAYQYRNFPRYSTLESLANSASIQLPILMIAIMAAPAEAGFVMLAVRVISGPMQLIGGAAAQIYAAQAPIEHRMGRLPEYTKEVLTGLLKSGVGILLFVGIVSPLVFPLIFGIQWTRSGEIVAWMTPWFIFQFLASPISMALHVVKNQRAALFLQIFGFSIRVAAVGVFSIWKNDWITEAYALSGFVFYSIYLCVALRLSGVSFLMSIRMLTASAWVLLFWVAGGVIVASGMRFL